MSQVPRRLLAPEPGWSRAADVVVTGSGIAGLTVALACARAGLHTLVVTKDVLDAGSTRWAQGGIAAALAPDDDPEDHLRDTLEAGAGLCDETAVRVLVTEGPAAVRRLIALGTAFDRDAAGELELTREGGHHRRRIAHAGGDATGAEIQRALVAAVRARPEIEVIEHALVLDALLDADGRVRGVTLHVMGEGATDGVGAVRARAVVLASGGLGHVFAATTNPPVSTGDGVALALRAGAVVQDLEFVQFHPTVLWLGADATGQQPLVSEAVRGEGAYLIDADGRRFMEGVHELADLAPRDVVARAITRVMLETGAPHVGLDARHFGAEMWRSRFPTILATCREHGIDPVTEPIPVVPAAHYASGGVRTDLHGATSVPGLYACGEVACTGVHGANRLASNSLLEGLVFAERIAAVLADGPTPGPTEPAAPPRPVEPAPPTGPAGLAAPPGPAGLFAGFDRAEPQAAMSAHAGVLRGERSLVRAEEELAALRARPATRGPGVRAWEDTNLLTVATALTAAALRRRETRGTHWREDHPGTDDVHHRGHVAIELLTTGDLAVRYHHGEEVHGTAEPHAAGPRDAGPRDAGPRDAGPRDAGPHAAEPQDAEPRAAEPDGVGAGWLPAETAEALRAAGLDADAVAATVAAALDEDVWEAGDLTSRATIPAGHTATGDLVARAGGVVAGLPVAAAVFARTSRGRAKVVRHVADGARVRRGDVLMSVTGETRTLLEAERTALNLLGLLSGVATATRRWADAVQGTGAVIRDTRKTVPGMRVLQKYAVRCGGGTNHRMSLSDAALIKDNHVLAAGGVAEAYRAVRASGADVPVQVEVDRIDQIEPVLVQGATDILLDNFTVPELQAAVELVAGRARLEASGGLTLEEARDVAETGVDYLAVGALTHSAPALDIALDLRGAAEA
ncbi:MAG: L-aspartate oxidase [Streptosporangiales bacterium]|nr:L-aspartate oxidase [Streptosporangiales bacterium]